MASGSTDTSRSSPPEQIELGCIGCGFIAGIHLANARELPGVRVRGVCDLDQAAAARAQESCGADYATGDAERLISDPAISAILVCTHVDAHAELTIAALKAGKHVFVEKPMTASAAEAEAMVAAADEADRWLAVDLKFRFSGAIATVHDAIGSPILLVGQAAMDPLPAGTPHLREAGAIGIAADLAPHLFDALVHLAHSDVLEVNAAAVDRPSLDRVAAVAGTLTFQSGAIASFVIGDAGEWSHASKWFYEVTDGRNRATITDHCRHARIDGPQAGEFTDSDPPHAVGTRAALADFAASITDRRPPRVDGRAGLRSVVLTEALRRAVTTGDRVRIAPPAAARSEQPARLTGER